MIVGVDHYAHVPSLEGAVADARDLSGVLMRDGVRDLTVLLNEKATRSAVLGGLSGLLSRSRPGDLALISYAGHGARVPAYPFPGWNVEPDGMNEEFALTNFAWTGAGSGDLIVNKEMKAWLMRFDRKGVDVLFIADTCFGGGAVRRFDSPARLPSERGLTTAAAKEPGDFRPMPMTRSELAARIEDLTHVTFLAGADQAHEVPEVFIPGQPGPRGALSYAVARVLEGRSEQSPGEVDRQDLFAAADLIAAEYSDGRQEVVHEPSSRQLAVLERPVARIAAAAPTAPAGGFDEPVLLAIVNGAIPSVFPAAVPFRLTTDLGRADLIWDVASMSAYSHGDLLLASGEPADLPGLLERAFAVRALRRVSEDRPQPVRLRLGARIYWPKGPQPVFEASSAGRDLVAFNIAADGTIQPIAPLRNQTAFTVGDWTYEARVTPPYGADELTVVTGPAASLEGFADWIWAHKNRREAALVAPMIDDLALRIPTLRVGMASLFTDRTAPAP